jgi:YVTN family beta-propeller protein
LTVLGVLVLLGVAIGLFVGRSGHGSAAASSYRAPATTTTKPTATTRPGPTTTVATAKPAATGKPTATTKPKPTTTTTTSPPFQRIPPGPPTDQRTMSLIKTIGGNISPKSVSASDTGFVFAQNMMYRHSVTVYDSSGNLVTTIPDTVNLSALGVPGGPTVQGAPVEAAFTPDANYVYVSNYSMYGPGQGPEGNDDCTPASAKAAGDTPSYIYRINVKTMQVDQVILAGLVPKWLQVTPNGKYLVVANWCSYDVDIIDTASAKVVADLPMGAYPRGIAISPDSSTAYVAIMGDYVVTKINLQNLTNAGSFTVGYNPRHVVIDPAGKYLYISLNAPGNVVKVDLSDDQVVATAHTGEECRSLAISTDGRSLYVVNYASNTVSKLRASDLSVVQTIPTGTNPIGITYDATTGDVWVAVYTGEILVFADQ